MPTLKFPKLTDEELIRQLLATGNAQYFEELYNRHFKKIYYQVIAYVKDSEEAQDLTQDIFVKLYDRLSKFQEKSSFSTWLFSLARNAALDYLRRKGKIQEDYIDDSKLGGIPEVDDQALFQIKADRLAHILNKVSPDDKAILVMKYAHEWQVDEIAETLGIGESAVKMRIKRAKAKILNLYKYIYKEE